MTKFLAIIPPDRFRDFATFLVGVPGECNRFSHPFPPARSNVDISAAETRYALEKMQQKTGRLRPELITCS
jgi:hypothetical protein